MAEIITRPQHNVIIENREKIHLSGVKEVKSFNDEEMVLTTELGELHIKGEGLHINVFNVDTGEMNIEGMLNAFGYKGAATTKGIIGKLLK
jgi:sporulation protein YabP